jgi:hypothetical protein
MSFAETIGGEGKVWRSRVMAVWWWIWKAYDETVPQSRVLTSRIAQWYQVVSEYTMYCV